MAEYCGSIDLLFSAYLSLYNANIHNLLMLIFIRKIE